MDNSQNKADYNSRKGKNAGFIFKVDISFNHNYFIDNNQNRVDNKRDANIFQQIHES